jgi:hypothetical protein
MNSQLKSRFKLTHQNRLGKILNFAYNLQLLAPETKAFIRELGAATSTMRK